VLGELHDRRCRANHAVEAGDDPQPIAATLKRSTMQQQSDFTRAIHYAPSRVA
jgi:hypothetical protein